MNKKKGWNENHIKIMDVNTHTSMKNILKIKRGGLDGAPTSFIGNLSIDFKMFKIPLH